MGLVRSVSARAAAVAFAVTGAASASGLAYLHYALSPERPVPVPCLPAGRN
ncbi:hypothetical protein [Dietzia sp. 179-F 9C3 NHS]|uniref:hypothetical protein n=1 Tax=Dietzia sp. 179-F 9C3 NHS TaxID=3374295 RepID=UPI003879C71E